MRDHCTSSAAAMNLVKERLAQKLEENKDKISTLKLKAAASLENVKGTLEDKVKNVDVQKLKEQVDSVREKSLTTAKSSFSNLSALLAQGSDMSNQDHMPGSADSAVSSESDGAVAEGERLMGGGSGGGGACGGMGGADKVRAGLGALGSKLAAVGSSTLDSLEVGKAKLNHSLDTARQASAKTLDRSLDTARQAGAKSADAARSVAAAGSSGVDKLKSLKSEAAGRCDDAIGVVRAASSGVQLPGGLGLGGARATKPPATCAGRLLALCCSCLPTLTYKQRLYGAGGCFVLGLLLSLLSLGSLVQLFLGNPLPFASKYTLGNLLSLGSAAFLVGPARQARTMFAPSRRLATIAYLGSMAGTLACVFVLRMGLLALLCILLQSLALGWYTLSYIPYGQAAAKRILRRLLKRAGFSGSLLPIELPSSTSSPSSLSAASAMQPAEEGNAV